MILTGHSYIRKLVGSWSKQADGSSIVPCSGIMVGSSSRDSVQCVCLPTCTVTGASSHSPVHMEDGFSTNWPPIRSGT